MDKTAFGIICVLLIVIIIITCSLIFTACNTTDNHDQTIIDLALADINETGDATLEHISTEQVQWLDYDCAMYILTVNGKRYEVSVQEKDGYVHYADVINEV